MLKLFGAVLLFAACSLLGIRYGQRYRRKEEFYGKLHAWLTMMELEITYSRSSMEELFERGIRDYPELSFLSDCLERLREGTDLQSAMHLSTEAFIRMNPDYKNGISAIEDFTSMLGTTDTEDQTKLLKLSGVKLQQFEEEAAADRRKYEKLYRSLGMLGGLATVLVIL